jgi:hypothetical protein
MGGNTAGLQRTILPSTPGRVPPAYAHIIIKHQPQKGDPIRICITMGGNLINYPSELTMRTPDMVSSKLLWNSAIGTPGARFAGANIKNMYLESLSIALNT